MQRELRFLTYNSIKIIVSFLLLIISEQNALPNNIQLSKFKLKLIHAGYNGNLNVQNSSQEKDEIVKVNTTLVSVPVKVTNQTGSSITDLGRADFHIYENGVEQRIAYFAPVDERFTVLLLLDISGSTRFYLSNIKTTAINFIEHLRPDDQIVVATFDREINILTEATGDHDKAKRAIRDIKSGSSTRLYDAVGFILQRLLSLPSRRKAVVLFTDGIDNASREYDFESSLRSVEKTNVLFFPIQYGGEPRSPTAKALKSRYSDLYGYKLFSAYSYLHCLAQETGGQLFQANKISDLEKIFSQLSDNLHKEYSIGYYPTTVPFDGERRYIKVTVDHPSLLVHARESYISYQSSIKSGAAAQVLADRLSFLSDKKSQTEQELSDHPKNAITDLFYSNGDMKLQPTCYFFPDRKGAFVGVELHLDLHDIQFDTEDKGSYKADILIAAYIVDVEHPNSLPVSGYEQILPIRLSREDYPLALEEGATHYFKIPVQSIGTYQVRFLARSITSGKIGYASRLINVSDISGTRFSISGIVIGTNAQRHFQVNSNNQFIENKELRAISALHRFQHGNNVQYRFIIYNPQLDNENHQPHLIMQANLYCNNRLIFTSKDISLKPIRQTDYQFVGGGYFTTSSELAPGLYILQIKVTDLQTASDNREATQWVYFEITK